VGRCSIASLRDLSGMNDTVVVRESRSRSYAVIIRSLHRHRSTAGGSCARQRRRGASSCTDATQAWNRAEELFLGMKKPASRNPLHAESPQSGSLSSIEPAAGAGK
jgi:hypothetical protein